MYGRGGGAPVVNLPLLNGCVIVACSFPGTARCLAAASYTSEYPLPDRGHQERARITTDHAPWRGDIRTPQRRPEESDKAADRAPPDHTCFVSPRAPGTGGGGRIAEMSQRSGGTAVAVRVTDPFVSRFLWQAYLAPEVLEGLLIRRRPRALS